MLRRVFDLILLGGLLLVFSSRPFVSPAMAQTSAAHGRPSQLSQPSHVFIIVLENKNFEDTFGQDSAAPYLAHDLTKQGELLTHYYGIGHFSLDNYIAMVSGIAPNPDTQGDCLTYTEFVSSSPNLDRQGQVTGRGCVHPSIVKTLPEQLEAKGLSWGGYMEDMTKPCQHPTIGQPDDHIHARAGDQYATRHNPFVYFHSLVDSGSCDKHNRPLKHLDTDLKSIATTPNFVFITPNLCNDGHDGPSAICDGGGLKSSDRFLREWVPKILASPAYQKDGMIIITFDEAQIGKRNKKIDPASTDAAACCNEPTGPNTSMPGLTGPGGGRIGALILSRYVRAGSINDTPYNHYSLLRSLEDLWHLDYLGYAGQPGLKPFGKDVYNARY